MNLKPPYNFMGYGIWASNSFLPGGKAGKPYPIIVQCFYVDDIGPGSLYQELSSPFVSFLITSSLYSFFPSRDIVVSLILP